MKQIYAIAWYCYKPTYGQVATAWGTGCVRAHSREEAIGMGVGLAMEKCPTSQGYQSHQADVFPVPQSWINDQAAYTGDTQKL